MISQVRDSLLKPLLDWSKSAFNLMQSEINALKVAVGNYSNGFLAVQDHWHVNQLVGPKRCLRSMLATGTSSSW
jgi:hypothetical protein